MNSDNSPKIRMVYSAATEEVFFAPRGMTETEAVLWLAHLYHPSAVHITRGPTDIPNGRQYYVSNRRRGVSARGVGIVVLDDARTGEFGLVANGRTAEERLGATT